MAGISHTKHPQLKKAAIFLYDGAPGGLGLVASLFDRFESLLETTLERIGDCACEEGCPACIHSPRCGSGNRPLDKQSAIRTLGLLLGHEPLPALETLELAEAAEPLPAEPEAAPEPDEAPPLRLVFFDLETQRSAQEVGGWHNAHLMRVALAVTFDTREGSYRSWYEADVAELIAHLKTADLVIGFNIVRFDYRVLRGYTDDDLTRLASFDMLDAIHARLGYRLPLAHLAEETLGIGIGETDARRIWIGAVTAKMTPMIEFLVAEFERSVLSKQQLSQKTGKDQGEDLISGEGGQLGIGSIVYAF